MIIKTVERTIPISDNYETISLLIDDIKRYKEEYNFLHLGCVQIGFKPLTREGLNTSMCVALCDTRHNKFTDSLLGLVETSLCRGPVYFNCYPNFEVSLTDKRLLDVLTLFIQTSGYDMKPGTENIALVYRVSFKVLNTLAPKARKFDVKGKTTLFEANMAKSFLSIPKTIAWSEVNLPERWSLPGIVMPTSDKHENREIEQIVETPEGNVEIYFGDKGRVAKFHITNFDTLSQTGRASTSSIPNTRIETESVIGLKESINKIPHAIYKAKDNKPESPTYSDMNFTINMIEHNEFKIDRNEINKEFNQPKYKIFRDWFFRSYTKEQTLEFKELFYKCLEENKIIIPFVDWFFRTQDNFPQINMINNYYKNWQTTHGPTITSLHPPLENKIFLSSSNGHPVTAHAISDTFTDNSTHEKILSQNNFTNMHLHTLGKQLTRVESNTDNIIQQINQPLKSIQPSIPVKQEHVLIPPPTYTQFNLQNKKETNLVNALVAKLEELKTQEKPTESSSLTVISKETTDKENNLESEDEEINMSNTELTQLNNQFKSLNEENENSLNKIEFDKRPLKNRVAYGRYYYPRPTPMDVLFEENFINTEKSSFSADQIYEWNIDGCAEQQIFAVLHKMLMYSTICKANNNSDANIANFIIAGFTGQLKGWWDNILTPLQRNEILTAKKLIQTTAPDTKIVTAEYFEDSVYTLIQTILKHFVGSAFHTMDCSRELLINLRCPTLTHFRWYKDVFLSKIMHRSDGNLSFWKEKYISDFQPYLRKESEID